MNVILSLAVALGAVTSELPEEIPQKRGDFAFRYTGRYTDEEMAWLSNFDIVVSGNLLPEDQVKALRDAGCKLCHYVWLPAFYRDAGSGRDSACAEAVREHPEWALNAMDNPLYGHAGGEGSPAIYVDYGNREFRNWAAAQLIEITREHGYDGVFFDTTTFESVHPEARKVFKERYPGGNYDQFIAHFLAALNNTAPDLIVFPNQGYRAHPFYLPFADYDLSESLMTSYAWADEAEVYVEGKGKTTVKESYVAYWSNPEQPNRSFLQSNRELILEPFAKFGYTAKMYHLNYGQPRYVPTGETTENGQPVFKPTLDREALHYGVACAHLLSHSSYYEFQCEGIKVPADPVYFVDLGKPLSDAFSHDEEKKVAWRFFENGFAVVNDSGETIGFPVDDKYLPHIYTRVYDTFEQAEVVGFEVNRVVPVPPSRYIATDRVRSSGRVFMYVY